jgi:hypothetical protein
MTSVIRNHHPRVDAQRLAVLSARATAEDASFAPRPIVRTRTPPVAGERPKYRGGRKGKPVRDEHGVTYGSATAAAQQMFVRPSDISRAARLAGRATCAGLRWWYVEDKR